MILTEVKRIGELYYLDEQLRRQGVYQTFHYNNQTSTKCHFVDDVLHGPYNSWFSSGIPCESTVYSNGNRDGLYQSWHYNGQLWESRVYQNTFIQGEDLTWYDNGQLHGQYNYTNSQLNGKSTVWYPNGTIKKQCFYLDDIWHGEYISYDPYGDIKSHLIYNNGTALPIDPSNLADKVKFELTMRYAIEWL